MFRSHMKSLLPPFVLRMYHRRKLESTRKRNGARPVSEVFTEIYEQNLWGGPKGEYWSGDGSADQFTQPYLAWLTSFIRDQFQGPVSIVDLGCGDFRVGRLITESLRDCTYVGVDIVDSLIRRNTEQFATDKVSFERRDIISDPLPPGQICLVRQVLQHLSNAQISAILPKLAQYEHVAITEHFPADDDFTPNKDKPHGGDVRLSDRSAVSLEQPPFNCKGLELRLTVGYEDGTRLLTHLMSTLPQVGQRNAH